MIENPNFLKKKYDLHNEPEVESAVKRKEARTGEKVSGAPEAKIQTYLDRFGEILEREDEEKRERGLEAIKKVLHKQFVIKPEEVPDGYFENQRRIAREQGHGDVEISDEIRDQLTEVIVTDQESSLDKWVDYFASQDAMYPDWLKYYATRSILSMGEYDKEKKQFTKRSKGTVKPFPDLNREALAYVLDAIEKKYEGEQTSLAAFEAEDKEAFDKLLQGENFGKLYAWAIDKVTPDSVGQLSVTQGAWVMYDQNSDHMPLVESLQGHGTGWCTVGESTAQTQLETGDFHVYYSLDEDGKPTIPRVAIRMEEGSIAEVRGVAPEQNLDPYITSIVQEKLDEFPDGKEYEKKVEDMKRLTELEKRQTDGEVFDVEDLKFLYETEGQVQGFGYDKDPRISEMQGIRDGRQDYADIFQCKREEVAITQDELSDHTIVFGRNLDLRNSQTQELPAGLTHISGGLYLEGSQLKELPAGLTHIGGNLSLEGSQLKELPAGLTHIGGSLDLQDSQIQELPAGLTHIGGHLYLEGSQLKELPDNIEDIVKGGIAR